MGQGGAKYICPVFHRSSEECRKLVLPDWRGSKARRKRQLLSLICTLSFTCKAVRAGRTFLRCLIKLSTTVLELDYFVRISLSAQVDIEWWFQYSASWNGASMMTEVSKSTPAVTLTQMHLVRGVVEPSQERNGSCWSGQVQ